MQLTYQIVRALSIGAFMYYGVSCLFADGMVAEFERFGLSRYRRLTGALELLGALGLLFGHLIPPLVVLASGGLTILMALGVLTRLRVGDPALANLPAVTLGLGNLFLLLHALQLLAPSP